MISIIFNINKMAAELTYFKGRGRGELIRLMLEVTGTPYGETTITKPLLEELRARGDLYYQQLPLLHIDGMKLVQSAAIVRYLARKHSLYGNSIEEATLCDMIADGLFDFRENFIMFSSYKQLHEDPALFHGKVRDKLIPRYMSAMENQLQRNNGGGAEGRGLVGMEMSYADVALLEVLELVEEVYPGLVRNEYPLVASFHDNMKEIARVKDYLSSERRNPPLNETYIAHVREILPLK